MTTVSSVAVDFGASFFATNTSTASTFACNISAANFVSGVVSAAAAESSTNQIVGQFATMLARVCNEFE